MAKTLVRRTPLIGITCEAVRGKKTAFLDYDLVCDHRYALAVKAAGGHPILLPIAHSADVLRTYLEGIDGLVIVGGDDVDPRHYGEQPKRRTKIIFPKRVHFERWLYLEGKRRRLPILAICYGMQLINVLEGGSLIQELGIKRKGPRVNHRGSGNGVHGVYFLQHTRLQRIVGATRAVVATQHHQGINKLAKGFVAAAVASDGIIEAIEQPRMPNLLAVQWHPERTPNAVVTRRIFRAFTRMCRNYRRQKP